MGFEVKLCKLNEISNIFPRKIENPKKRDGKLLCLGGLLLENVLKCTEKIL